MLYQRLTLVLGLIALAVAPNDAAVISNGTPDLGGATDLNLNLAADDFTLAAASTITSIRFWTAQDDLTSYAGTTEFSFRSNNSGVPGAIVQSGSFVSTQTSTPDSTFGLTIFRHDGVVNVSLGAGTYWLVLHNGPSSVQPSTSFYWAFSDSQQGNAQAFELPAGPWGGISAELAFELNANPDSPPPPPPPDAAVPEPTSLLLVGAGVVVFAIRRFRRNQ